MLYDPKQPTKDRFQPGDLVRSKHVTNPLVGFLVGIPCLVLDTHESGNRNLCTVHDPDKGIKNVIASDYVLLVPANDEMRDMASARLAEQAMLPRADDVIERDPWEDYIRRCR